MSHFRFSESILQHPSPADGWGGLERGKRLKLTEEEDNWSSKYIYR